MTSQSAKDWSAIIAIVVVTAFLIYLVGWFAVAIIIVIAAAYLIFRWYRANRPLAPT